MSDTYVDPLVKVVGSLLVLGISFLLLAAGAYWVAIYQIDNSTDYCHATKTYVPVKECRGVR